MTKNIYTSIFLSNKYTNWYFNIINNARNRPISGYTEYHHIIPKSLGGSNELSNLIHLTAREHFICHMLLMFMIKHNSKSYHKMVKAAIMMKPNCNGKRYVSRLYDLAKKRFSKIQSHNQSGKSNTQYGTVWVSNFKTKECIKIKKDQLDFFLDNEWIKKRVMDFSCYNSFGNKLTKRKPPKKSYIEKLRFDNNLTDPIPRKILASQFFNRKSNIPILIGFNLLADNIENEYFLFSKNLKELKKSHSYKDIRLKFSIPNDRTITKLLRLFDVIE